MSILKKMKKYSKVLSRPGMLCILKKKKDKKKKEEKDDFINFSSNNDLDC